jgi:hypothetical protein
VSQDKLKAIQGIVGSAGAHSAGLGEIASRNKRTALTEEVAR